jgi:hypothetical protein
MGYPLPPTGQRPSGDLFWASSSGRFWSKFVSRKRGASDKSDLTPPKQQLESVHYTRYFGGVGRDPSTIRGTLERPSRSAAYSVRIGPHASNVPRIVYGFEKRVVSGPLKSQHTMGKYEKWRRRSKVASLIAMCVSPAREPYFALCHLFFLSIIWISVFSRFWSQNDVLGRFSKCCCESCWHMLWNRKTQQAMGESGRQRAGNRFAFSSHAIFGKPGNCNPYTIRDTLERFVDFGGFWGVRLGTYLGSSGDLGGAWGDVGGSSGELWGKLFASYLFKTIFDRFGLQKNALGWRWLNFWAMLEGF